MVLTISMEHHKPEALLARLKSAFGVDIDVERLEAFLGLLFDQAFSDPGMVEEASYRLAGVEPYRESPEFDWGRYPPED